MIFVITGTRKGIGKLLAQYYLEHGHTVIGCSRNESELQHQNYYHFCVDVSSDEEVSAFITNVKRKFKYVDVLINNAGTAAMNHFMLTPVETAERLMKLNYLGTFNCCRGFLSLLRKSCHPRIVNFTTVAVPLDLGGEIAYVASKAAIESFSKVLAKELAQFNITVNCIGPAPTKTDLIKNVPKEKIDKLIDSQAIKHFCEFNDIVNVINFYVNPNSDFITGQILYLGGIMR